MLPGLVLLHLYSSSLTRVTLLLRLSGLVIVAYYLAVTLTLWLWPSAGRDQGR
jgi:hypothetical protein